MHDMMQVIYSKSYGMSYRRKK